MPRDKQRAHDAIMARLMTDIAKRFPVVSMERFLCDDKLCRVLDGDVAIYRDDGHFSKSGSIHLGETLGFYRAFATAAEKGCRPGENVPSGLCEMTPANGGAPLLPAKVDITPAKAPG